MPIKGGTGSAGGPIAIAWRRIPAARLLLAALALATGVGLGFGPAQQAKDPLEPWKLSTAVGPAFALGKAGERWAQLIAEKADGKLAVRLFPGAALAQRDPAREFVALRDGAADLAVGSTLFWSAQVTELNVDRIAVARARAEGPRRARRRRREGAARRGDRARRRRSARACAVLGHRALATTARRCRSPDDLARPEGPHRVDAAPRRSFMRRWARSRTRWPFADAQAALRGGHARRAGRNARDVRRRAPRRARAQARDAVGRDRGGRRVRRQSRGVGRLDRGAARGRRATRPREAARELPALARAEDDAALASSRKRGVTVTRLTATGRAAFAAAARGVYDKWAAVAGADLVRAAEAAIEARHAAARARRRAAVSRRSAPAAPRSRPSSGGASA